MFGKLFRNWSYAWKQNIFFVFWKGKLIQKFWDFFCKKNFRNISEKTEYFDIGSISYSVNIQPDIMQN